MATKKKPAARKAAKGTFSAEEKAAIKDYIREKKGGKSDGAADLQAAIARMKEPDRGLARRVHALVSAAAPELQPKTWYGMPAWHRNGDTICFFQDAAKFKSRYATLGFSDKAKLDDGTMWPTGFALKDLTPADEAKITALVKRAVS